MKKIFAILVLALLPSLVLAASVSHELDSIEPDLENKASLQRGAALLVNYCLGCHSLQYMRHKHIQEYLEIPPELYTDNLIFNDQKLGDLVKIAMPEGEAGNWFGQAPPDLTLEARLRGPDWIYSYLRGFYKDETRPLGVNNVVYPNVGMPHVLAKLQGLCAVEPNVGASDHMEPLSGSVKDGELCDEWASEGSMDAAEFNQAMYDLTNFLVYVGEPAQVVRKELGVYVLIFIAIFFVFAYLLNREYWKDVH
jgi:ubiquinol-cytochrome c reductase cytochrome c1 subunit